MSKLTFLAFFLLISCLMTAQPFTRADSLRGHSGSGRDCWDVLKYDLHVTFNYSEQTISGYNTIWYKTVKKSDFMQIDLQEPLVVDSCPGFRIVKDGNAYFLFGFTGQVDNSVNAVTIYYHGKPRIAKHPPWEGGMVWTKDRENNPWISIACQGTGASVWVPCKDDQSDKSDSAELHITCPDTLMAVGNGRFVGSKNNKDGTMTDDWKVVSPINSYCIIPAIGKYVHFGERYKGEKGDLDMDYWVLPENLEKAKTQFKDADRTIKAFEYWFGPYPFYEDGYKLVDAPFLGMEHQSDIAYGNNYENGYRGRDLSGSGWGMKWDFIIVHESAHEWFGNNLTAKDIADLWIHESFANYAETLFTEYYYGKEAGNAYCIGIRKLIKNDRPVIGPYGVNQQGSEDMYDKGGNMIHTIRQIINDDEKFRMILWGLNEEFYHQTVSSRQVEEYISGKAAIDLSKVFDQYLRTANVPVFEYKIRNGVLSYRWKDCVKGFNMPVKVTLEKDKYSFIYPTEVIQNIKTGIQSKNDFRVDENFYVLTAEE
jgi:aminopeptidase N